MHIRRFGESAGIFPGEKIKIMDANTCAGYAAHLYGLGKPDYVKFKARTWPSDEVPEKEAGRICRSEALECQNAGMLLREGDSAFRGIPEAYIQGDRNIFILLHPAEAYGVVPPDLLPKLTVQDGIFSTAAVLSVPCWNLPEEEYLKHLHAHGADMMVALAGWNGNAADIRAAAVFLAARFRVPVPYVTGDMRQEDPDSAYFTEIAQKAYEAGISGAGFRRQ